MGKILKALCCLVAAATLFVAAPAPAQAADAYEETDTYVMHFGNSSAHKYWLEYGTPFTTNLSYEYASDDAYEEFTGMFGLYSTFNNERVIAYCVDQYTGIKTGSYYKRTNLEDSTYFSDETAAKLRSIVLNGFPNTSVSALASAAGAEGLTELEAVHATQLAIWQTSYGSTFSINKQISGITDYWDTRGYPSVLRNIELFRAEYAAVMAMDEDELAEVHNRVGAVYNYLMNLDPVAQQ